MGTMIFARSPLLVTLALFCTFSSPADAKCGNCNGFLLVNVNEEDGKIHQIPDTPSQMEKQREFAVHIAKKANTKFAYCKTHNYSSKVRGQYCSMMDGSTSFGNFAKESRIPCVENVGDANVPAFVDYCRDNGVWHDWD